MDQVKKRKVGRPKGSKNKSSSIKSSTECFEIPIKRKRGRPRKELSKVDNNPKLKEPKDPVKRGRPKKEYPRNDEIIDMSNVKTFKLLGHCPECLTSLCSVDLEEGKKTIFTCYSCGHRGKTSKLLSETPEKKLARNKKEFLEDTIQTAESDNHTYKNEVPNEFEDLISSASKDWES